MDSAVNFFPANLRFLRERSKQSQEQLAQQLGFSRIKLQSLESGKTLNPLVGDLLRFSAHFKISVDTLLKVNLRDLDDNSLQEFLSENDAYLKGSHLRILAITVDGKNNENVEYVPVKARAGYNAGYNDPEFISSLPKCSIPNLPKSGTFRIFPTTGDSMLPIPENSEVIAQYVADWKSMKPDTPCIVILRGVQDFVFKLVTVNDDGKILLRSLNTNYQPYFVDAEEVLEIWKYYKHQTNVLPTGEVTLDELKELILDIDARLRKISKKIE